MTTKIIFSSGDPKEKIIDNEEYGYGYRGVRGKINDGRMITIYGMPMIVIDKGETAVLKRQSAGFPKVQHDITDRNLTGDHLSMPYIESITHRKPEK
jgi:hypothetical protein